MTLLLGLAIVGAAGAQSEDLEAFLKNFAEKRDAVKVMQAQFTQDNVTADDEYRCMGEILYRRPRTLLFRYFDPEVYYLVEGTEVHEYDPELEQMQIHDMSGHSEAEAMFLGFQEDTTRLREAYDLSLFDASEVAGAFEGLELTPKVAGEPGGDGVVEVPLFERVRLYLREGDLLPIRIRIVKDADSHVTIRVTDIDVSAELDPDAFTLNLPEGTLIVQGEKIVETVGAGGKRVPGRTSSKAEADSP